jgi:hypothetical protein
MPISPLRSVTWDPRDTDEAPDSRARRAQVEAVRRRVQGVVAGLGACVHALVLRPPY